MQITLVRHGRPDFSSGWVAARELIQAHRRYDAVGIRSDFPPPSRLRAEASRADIIGRYRVRRPFGPVAGVQMGVSLGQWRRYRAS